MLKADNKNAGSLSTSLKSETRNRNLKRCGIINNFPVKKKLAPSQQLFLTTALITFPS